MKTVQLFLILAALFSLSMISGCNDCQADLEAKNKEIVRLSAEAIMNEDYEALDQYMAADYVRHCQATPDAKVESLEEFINLMKFWNEALSEAGMEMHLMAAEGDLVAFYATFYGMNTGPMGDTPPTGKRMDSETFGFHRLKDRKIVETWVTWDNMAIMQQLGLIPPPEKKQP